MKYAKCHDYLQLGALFCRTRFSGTPFPIRWQNDTRTQQPADFKHYTIKSRCFCIYWWETLSRYVRFLGAPGTLLTWPWITFIILHWETVSRRQRLCRAYPLPFDSDVRSVRAFGCRNHVHALTVKSRWRWWRRNEMTRRENARHPQPTDVSSHEGGEGRRRILMRPEMRWYH